MCNSSIEKWRWTQKISLSGTDLGKNTWVLDLQTRIFKPASCDQQTNKVAYDEVEHHDVEEPLGSDSEEF